MRVILAAEDDFAARHVLQAIVDEVEGWALTSVEDGSKLVAALETVRPALIVLDVNMPGINGLEVYNLLRAREDTRDVPVLFLTSTPRTVREAALEGTYAVLAKPYDVDDLLKYVARLMDEPVPDI